MKLTLVPSVAGLTHVQCDGEITQHALWENDNPLDKVLGDAGYAGKVLVDLEKVAYIDSAGVGWFIGCHKQFREAGGMLVLHSIPVQVNQIFQLLQMHKVLHLAKDAAAALALAQGAPHE